MSPLVYVAGWTLSVVIIALTGISVITARNKQLRLVDSAYRYNPAVKLFVLFFNELAIQKLFTMIMRKLGLDDGDLRCGMVAPSAAVVSLDGTATYDLEIRDLAILCASSGGPGGMKPIVRFLWVYSQEASDGVGLNGMKPVLHLHRCLEDRMAAARKFIAEVQFVEGEVVCDSMADEARTRFDAYPERILVIEDGRIVHEGGAQDRFGMHTDVNDVISWVKKRTESSNVVPDVPSQGATSSAAAHSDDEEKEDVCSS